MKKLNFGFFVIVLIFLFFSSCSKRDDTEGTLIVELVPVWPYCIRFSTEGYVPLPLEVSYIWDHHGLLVVEKNWIVDSFPSYVKGGNMFLYSNDSIDATWIAKSDEQEINIKIYDYRNDSIIIKK